MMMALFWRLFLGHLLADFPLQPNALIELKNKPAGLALHLGTHLVVMLALTWPVAAVIWPGLVGLILFHGILDQVKVHRSDRLGLSEPAAYLLDQALHLASLALTAWAFTAASDRVAALPLAAWSIQGAVFILGTHFWAITERILTVNSPAYQAEVIEQTWPRMAARGLPLLIVIAAYPAGSLSTSASVLPYAGMQYWRRALLTDLVVSVFGVLALLLFA
ncbi:MAG: DUF3307 domain-containing protein [Anaerolineales bacterium]|jgi:hypothetical protein